VHNWPDSIFPFMELPEAGKTPFRLAKASQCSRWPSPIFRLRPHEQRAKSLSLCCLRIGENERQGPPQASWAEVRHKSRALTQNASDSSGDLNMRTGIMRAV
jgi:hypothetical protein